MGRHNPKNERIKRRYIQYLTNARGFTDASVDKALAAIARFEDATRWKGFDKFHIEQAIAFRAKLGEERNPATGRPLATGTKTAILKALRAFFRWLSTEPGYGRRIRTTDAEYFNPTNREDRIARSAEQRPSPSIEQVRYVLDRMPAETAVQRRDRAILAFLLLTGIRDGAAIDLKLRHVDLAECLIRQDAREIRTKFSKTMPTWFFPVGDGIAPIFADYVRFLREELLFSPDDPLLPATDVNLGDDGGFVATGLSRRHWSSASRMRQIVGDAFEAHGMPRYGPHSFRKTLARLGQQLCQSPEQLKVWSQNLGHEDVMTTLRSYGQVPAERQREVLANLRDKNAVRVPERRLV